MVNLKPATRAERILVAATAVVAANLPDADFLPGILIGEPGRFHHGASHSLVAAVASAAAAYGIAKAFRLRTAGRIGLLVGLAVLSHLGLDMISSLVDRRHGIPLLWPFSSYRFSSPYPLLIGIYLDMSRGTLWRALVHLHNLAAVAWEAVLVGALWLLFRPRSKGPRVQRSKGPAF